MPSSLHRLPGPFRIDFKRLSFVFNAFKGQGSLSLDRDSNVSQSWQDLGFFGSAATLRSQGGARDSGAMVLLLLLLPGCEPGLFKPRLKTHFFFLDWRSPLTGGSPVGCVQALFIHFIYLIILQHWRHSPVFYILSQGFIAQHFCDFYFQCIEFFLLL